MPSQKDRALDMMQFDHLPWGVREFLRQESEKAEFPIDAFKLVKLYESNRRKGETIYDYARRYVAGDFMRKRPNAKRERPQGSVR